MRADDAAPLSPEHYAAEGGRYRRRIDHVSVMSPRVTGRWRHGPAGQAREWTAGCR